MNERERERGGGERERERVGILVTYNGVMTIIATAVVTTDAHKRSDKRFGGGLRIGNGSGYGDDGSHG